MSLWKKLVCMAVGHKSSLRRGGVPGIRLSFPREPSPTEVVAAAVAAQTANQGNPGLFTFNVGNRAVALTSDVYDLDVCKRCFEVHARPPPAKCANCGREEFYHTKNKCSETCGNCRQIFEAHTDGKCPFDATTWKTMTYEPQTP